MCFEIYKFNTVAYSNKSLVQQISFEPNCNYKKAGIHNSHKSNSPAYCNRTRMLSSLVKAEIRIYIPCLCNNIHMVCIHWMACIVSSYVDTMSAASHEHPVMLHFCEVICSLQSLKDVDNKHISMQIEKPPCKEQAALSYSLQCYHKPSGAYQCAARPWTTSSGLSAVYF